MSLSDMRAPVLRIFQMRLHARKRKQLIAAISRTNIFVCDQYFGCGISTGPPPFCQAPKPPLI